MIDKQTHLALTNLRNQAFEALFGGPPLTAFPFHMLGDDDEGPFIDVLVYQLALEGLEEPVFAAVTNGMSDLPPPAGGKERHELVQYFRKVDLKDAQRLHDLAWLPVFDGFALDTHETIAWGDDEKDNPFPNALFLDPIVERHAEFSMELEGDPLTLLWVVPLTDKELAFKKRKGVDALIDRMEAIDLPWVFDEADRPSLV